MKIPLYKREWIGWVPGPHSLSSLQSVVGHYVYKKDPKFPKQIKVKVTIEKVKK